MNDQVKPSLAQKAGGKISFRTIQSASVSILLIIMVAVAAVRIDTFFTWGNLVGNLLTNAASLGIIACGMTFVMIAGGFDLSVASITAVCTVVAVLLMMQLEASGAALALGAAVLLAMLAGLGLGAVNGGLIAYVGVNPFVVTLSTMLVFRGLALILTSGGQTRQVPLVFGETVRGIYWSRIALFGSEEYYITCPILIFVAVFLVSVYVLRYTRFGHYVYSVGGNENAAWLAGINTSLVKAATYAICGLTCAIAALIYTGATNTAQASSYKGMELLVIAAVIVGGTPLGGGSGGLFYTLNGLLLLSAIENILAQLSVPEESRNIARGLIILVVVTVDVLARRKQQRR